MIINQSDVRHNFLKINKTKTYSMKKIVLTSFMIVFFAAASFAQQFGVGGVHRGGTSPEMKQKMKERLKTELKLTDDQVNTVSVLMQDYQLKSRSIKMDTNTSDADKKTKLKALNEERKQKLKETLSDEQINKLDAITKQGRKRRAQRQGESS